MFPKEQIIKALTKVIHPEKGKDIVTLGMVTRVESLENGISILITPEKANDPFISSIKSTIAKTINSELGPEAVISDISVNVPEKKKKHEETSDDLLPGVKNIIAISSGKGGVGKTTVAVNLAVALARKGFSTGLLDADVFGPSVPKMFGEENFRPEVYRANNIDYIIPLTKFGVRILSTGFFVDPSDAVVWRGPMASNFLKQLIAQGEWGQLDYLLFDLPPGTSDIQLTLVQEIPVTGAIVVSTPQEVALADAVKGISMFRSDKINVPVLGIVENMSWFTPAELPENRYYIFGKDGCKTLGEKMDVPVLGQIPIVQSICESSDQGRPAALDDSPTGKAFMELADQVVEKVNKRNREIQPTRKVEMNK